MAISQRVLDQTQPSVIHGQNGHWEDAIESEDGRQVSEEDYWANYYEKGEDDHSYEWNNGYLELKPMPDYRQYRMYDWLLALLRCYLSVRPIAKMVALEIGFRLALPNKVTIRKPDVFIVRNDNPIDIANDDRSYKGICDLAIESLSDSRRKEVERDTVQKKGEYAGVGVHEYYILDARGRHMAFYRINQQGTYDGFQPDKEGLIRSTVLPGFQFRVEDLYLQPALLAMATDPVYQAFVLPEYQAEKARAERERARAERLAARLRELGMDDE